MSDEPAVTTLRRVMAAQTHGHHLDPGAADAAWAGARTVRQHRFRTALAVAASVVVVGGGAAALSLARDTHGTHASAGSSACAGNISTGELPTWAQDGFSSDALHTRHVFSASGDLVGILFVDLRAHQPAGTNNKILWVAKDGYGPLHITGRLEGSGATAQRTVDLGPSIVDLPSAGCWRMTLSWSGHTDTIALQYR